MNDKPVASKIILTLADEDATGEEFIGLSTTLYQQNLIYSEPRELRKKEGKLELSVIFQDISSFNNWKSNPEVIAYFSPRFNAFLTEELKTVQELDVIIELDNVVNCTCDKPGFYILNGRSMPFSDELMCGICVGNIPYSRIPLDIKIENWQKHHQRIYLNWLESSFFEKEALKELTSYRKGKLNIEGEKIRKQLAAFFGYPVYLKFFVENPDENNTCLICNGPGEVSGLKRPRKICKNCNIAFCFSDL